MEFCGVNTKYQEGEYTYLLIEGKYIPVKVETIGILGGKLSKFVFLYHVKDSAGTTYDVTEERLVQKPPYCILKK